MLIFGLKIGTELNSLHGTKELITQAEKSLCFILSTEKARICLYDKVTNQMIWYGQNGEENRGDLSMGIFGHVIKKKEIENITNGYNHELFNGKVDIETSMPLICWPINHPNNENEVIGAIEAIYARGLKGVSALKKSTLNPFDHELLELFAKQLSQLIVNRTRYGSSSENQQIELKAH